VQREAVEALIQELPKFRLKAVPTDCSECPICLEEFHVGNEVKSTPRLVSTSINLSQFGFSRYIVFAMHLDIHYVYA
jgi:hypothetical protein